MAPNLTPPNLDLFSFSCDLQIRFSDIDGYMHVNNGVYYSYFEHARALYLYQTCGWNVMEIGTVVGKTTIEYIKPIHLDDELSCLVRCTRLGNSSFDLEQLIMSKKGDGTAILSKCNTVMVSVDMKTMKPTPIPEAYRSKLLPQG